MRRFAGPMFLRVLIVSAAIAFGWTGAHLVDSTDSNCRAINEDRALLRLVLAGFREAAEQDATITPAQAVAFDSALVRLRAKQC